MITRMPGDEEDSDFDDEESGPGGNLKGQIIGASRTFLAYFQARAQLFSLEAREASDQIGKRLTYMAIGGALLFLGYVLLVAGLIPVIADSLEVSWKLVSLIAAALHVCGGAVFIVIGLKAFSNPTFEETQNELEKDREWLARNLPTSNAKKPR
ncbi:MAG: putative membrane protein YqjE [Verrucomicrobiales bacterium]|jgi:uncharacterized membrane protein YqjE